MVGEEFPHFAREQAACFYRATLPEPFESPRSRARAAVLWPGGRV